MVETTDLLERGIACFNAGDYREALLAFEQRWHGERKEWLRVLVLCANSFLHLHQGRVSAPRFNLQRAAELLAATPDLVAGIDMAALRELVAATRQCLPASDDLAADLWAQLPRPQIRRAAGWAGAPATSSDSPQP